MVPFVTIEGGIEGINEEEVGGNICDVGAVIVAENESVCEVTFQFVDVGVIPGNPVFPPLVKHDVGSGVVAGEEVRETGGSDVEVRREQSELYFPNSVENFVPFRVARRHIVANAQRVNTFPVFQDFRKGHTEDQQGIIMIHGKTGNHGTRTVRIGEWGFGMELVIVALEGTRKS